MTIELSMLFWTVVLTFALLLLDVTAKTLKMGLVTVTGNQENMPALTGWMLRLNKSFRNAVETLPLFAALVLIAHALGISTDLTVLGVQLFFWGRVAHAIVFTLGIPWLRTGVWTVAMVGMVLVGIAILNGPAIGT